MTIYGQIGRNKLRTYLIVGLFAAFILGFFYLLGLFFASPGAYFAAGLAVSGISALGSYFYSDKIVLAAVKAKPARKEEYFDFYTVAENLSIAAGVPTPKLYVIDDPAPNAFATGRDPKHAVVCATTGLLNKLDRAEIEGVVAHELSHVKNYDILLTTVVAVLAGTVALISNWALRFRWGRSSREENEGRGGALLFVVLLAALILGPLAAKLMQLALSRKREFLADADGALLTRYPEGLARALEKIAADKTRLRTASVSTAHLFIANPLKKGQVASGLARLLSTHPPIEERIRLLRSM
jgi:heat shock protein HtpX